MLLLLGSLSSWAATYNVPGDYPNITAAVIGVSPNDTIVLGPGVHNLSVGIDKDLEIRGAGVDSTSVQGNGGEPVFFIGDGIALSLIDLEVDGQDTRRGVWSGVGSSFTGDGVRVIRGQSTFGGGVFSQQASFDCSSCEFANNTAFGSTNSQGGGLYIEDSVATLTDCIIRDNFATSGGGGVTLNQATVLDVVGGEFARNTGGLWRGGDVFIFDGGTLQMTGTSLYESSSGLGGSIGTGGNALQDITLDGVSFDGHSSTGGGAIWVEGGSLVLQGSSITNATAGLGWGGGIFSGQGAQVTIVDSTLQGNSANRGGGAHFENSTSRVLRSRFCNNSANGGGGLSTGNPVQQEVRNSLFLENTGSSEGGALRVEGSPVIAHSVFLSNTAGYGPAISAGDGNAEMINSLVGLHIGAPAVASWGAGVDLAAVGFWDNTGGDFEGPVIGTYFTLPDPEWVDGSPASCSDSFIPAFGGQLVDLGAANSFDLDGSIADVGLTGGPDADPALWVDADTDGVVAMWDCDDNNSSVSPVTTEVCDGVDNNCDGVVDEGSQGTVWYADTDSDGLGDPNNTVSACFAPPGYVDNPGDCDDSTDQIGGPTDVYLDSDGDGFGELSQTLQACGVPSGYAALSGDCSPDNSAVFPGTAEVCNGLDDDCDGGIDNDTSNAPLWGVDSDGDGHGSTTITPTPSCTAPPGMVALIDDCNDSDITVYTGAPELCDGVDNDCDNAIDEEVISQTWFIDSDGDGYGDQASAVPACAPGVGEAAQGGDCDDGDDTIFPNAIEVCDGVDRNCDGVVDNGSEEIWPDADGDGFGDSTLPLLLGCPAPGLVPNNLDCADLDASIYPSFGGAPGGAELCDTVDNDCDELIDTADPDLVDGILTYPDQDGDGFGDGTDSLLSCGTVSGRVEDDADCDDSDSDIYPGAPEVPDNGVDEDCDGFDREQIATGDTGPFDTDVPDTDAPPDTDVPDTGGGSEPLPRSSTGCGCSTDEARPLWGWVGWGVSRRRR